MFRSSTFLKLRETTVYDLRPAITDEKRLELLSKALIRYPKLQINNQLNPYYSAYQIIQHQKQQDLVKYQNSVLWSPRFTPWHFKFTFLIPFTGVALLLLYIRYIYHPQRMLELKQRLGIKFRELEKRGWLQGWEEEDPVVEFEAWTLADLDRLEQQGVIGEKREQKIKEKQKKFVSGNKEFILKTFGKN